jgi:hypothetical protein
VRKLLLVGDSWSCGEWEPAPDHPANITLGHPGMTEYLSSDYSIVNLSKGGASNWQICYALANYLKFGQWDTDPPTIFVFQSDAWRPAMSGKFDVDTDLMMQKSDSLLNFYTRMLEIFYIKLNLFAEEYQVKLHLIGGLSDLDLEILSLYNNLIPCCESWAGLLNHQHVTSQIPLTFDSRIFDQAKKNNRTDLMDEIVSVSDRNFVEAQKLLESDYFGPAFGDYHPNRLGHKIMADYIKNYLKDIS